MKQVAHVDMDAFFVSVELLYRPELRGQPVVVGARGDQRGVVAAASYEARRYGIHSAMPSRTAQRLCPHAVFLPGNHGLYEKWSGRVRGLLERFTPVVHMVSIDEAYLDLTGTERLHGSGWQSIQKIQRTVWEETELPCSIGLARSCVVAKVASDAAKPRGLLWVPPGAEAAFLAPLPVRRIPGIGKVTEKALHGLRVRSVGELARVSRDRLEEVFGQWGESLYRKAHGEDSDLWFLDEEQKSISHERTFERDVGDLQQLEATVAYLSELVGRRLREARLRARTVGLKLRYANFQTLTRAVTLKERTDLDSTIYRAAVGSLRRAWDRRRHVRLLGVAAGSLVEDTGQLPLLDADTRARQQRLAAAADAVRNRFGADAIASAKSMLRKSVR